MSKEKEAIVLGPDDLKRVVFGAGCFSEKSDVVTSRDQSGLEKVTNKVKIDLEGETLERVLARDLKSVVITLQAGIRRKWNGKVPEEPKSGLLEFKAKDLGERGEVKAKSAEKLAKDVDKLSAEEHKKFLDDLKKRHPEYFVS